MNKKTMERMLAATEQQAANIRKKPCFTQVGSEFNIEYQVAVELAGARAAAKLSQSQVAALMGTTQSVVSRIEKGNNVSIETLARYASACGRQLVIHLA